ncbi:hypothetical protein A5696_18550 [Mycobacterium sp. E2699]|uniref:DUF732 domain-containing protein n=1 Tax=Mycobacterium sp. E2699 TaxID=1834137 RepID=UPI0007FEDFFB|nr:DUF732 domain-containing protein [Mycobacterium sp. E2699]OBG99668.1 hypothetical protein A5696_18550 [Mycobacterium sp. E2699]
MFFRAAQVAVAGSVIGGIGFAAPALVDVADDYFIQALDGYGMQYGTLEKAILVAKTYVCAQLDANPGQTINDVVSGVASNTGWSNADSAFFTGSAIAAYCPEYKYVVDANAPAPVGGPENVPIS